MKRTHTLLALLALALLAQPVLAQTTAPAADQTRRMNLLLNQSATVDSPTPVVRAAVTNPKIADVQVLSPKQVLVMGKGLGATDLILWDKDETAQRTRIDVTVDLEGIKQELLKAMPGAVINIAQSRDSVVVSGTLLRLEQGEQLHKYLDSGGFKYVDMTTIAGLQQVQLQVRVAEASRQAIRALGVNAVIGGTDAFGGVTVGPFNGGPINPISVGPPLGASITKPPFNFTQSTVVSPAVTLFGGLPTADLEVFVQALAENQYLRVLAEPTLVALSGEEARFLAGGEFPVPVAQSINGGGTTISVEYKEFGVRLRFKPVVLGDGTIRLHVAPEVSEISDIGAVEIAGFRIPSITARKAETTLELKTGQTFAMAGLINRTTAATSSRVPGAGDLPIIGALFRTVRYTSADTEILVMVTANLVEPSSNACTIPLPGSLHIPPNDWEFYGCGLIEGRCSEQLACRQLGFVHEKGLDRLKGPGAWADYMYPGCRMGSQCALPAEQCPPPKSK